MPFVQTLAVVKLLDHQQQEPVENRQQYVFLGREVVGQLTPFHARQGFDFGERKVMKSLRGNDFDGRLDDLLASLAGNITDRSSSLGRGRRHEIFIASLIGLIFLDRSD